MSRLLESVNSVTSDSMPYVRTIN